MWPWPWLLPAQSLLIPIDVARTHVSLSSDMLPWTITPEKIERTLKFYPGREVDARTSLEAFYYNGSQVPGLFCIAIWIAFIVLIIGNGVIVASFDRFPAFRRSTLITWLRGHVVKPAIGSVTHHRPAHLCGTKRGPSIRLPLRFELFVVLVLAFVNVSALVAFYRLTPPEVNVFFTGPTSRRDQFARHLADRSGILAIGQVPLVILMAGRNSPVTAVSGLNYNSLMLWHRWTARMTWFQVNVHSLTYFVIASANGRLGRDFTYAYWRWGCAATVMWWGLTILAMSELRRRAYEVWLLGHVAFAVVGLVGTYYHIELLKEKSLYAYVVLVYISAGIWMFDRILRLALRARISYYTLRATHGRSIMAQASVEVFPGLTRLQIEVPAACLTFLDEVSDADEARRAAGKIAPGHSVQLLVPRVEWISDHPFTVCDTCRSSTDPTMGRMTLLVKSYGGMTRRLETAARRSGGDDVLHDIDVVASPTFRTPVIVEGPYGGLHNYMSHSDVILLFAGGIGITWCLPFLTHLALQQPDKQCKLVWNVKTLDQFLPVQEQLLQLVDILRKQGSRAAVHSYAIDIHVTGSDGGGGGGCVANLDSSESSEETDKLMPPNEQGAAESRIADELRPWFSVKVHDGRSINSVAAHVAVTGGNDRSAETTMSLGIAACGPASLCDDVRAEANKALLSRAWSDVDHVEECFSW